MDASIKYETPFGALATIGAGGIMSAADAAGASLGVPVPFHFPTISFGMPAAAISVELQITTDSFTLP